MLLDLAGCGALPRRNKVGALDARYVRSSTHEHRPTVATSAYREILAKSLGARCRMLPSDSERFDEWGRRCGGARGAVLGVARLYLEVAASPQFLSPVIAEGALKWVDLPHPAGTCAP
jgi:hypothetical protein